MSLLVISHLAEYPICSLSKKSTIQELFYTDYIMLNGARKKRQWRAYSSTPVGSTTYQILINLIQLWDQKSDTIFFSRQQLLAMMGQEKSSPKRSIIKKNLEALTSLKIEMTLDGDVNIFVLFQEVFFSSREKSFIMFSKHFHSIATRIFKERSANLYYLDLELDVFNSLTPIQQKLALYLGKWLKHYKTIYRPLPLVYSAIPIGGAQPKKQKQTLKEAMKALEAIAIFKSWKIEEPKKLGGDEILWVSKEIPQAEVIGEDEKKKELPQEFAQFFPSSQTTVFDEHDVLAQVKEFLPTLEYQRSEKWWTKVSFRVSPSDMAMAISFAKEHLQNLREQKKHIDGVSPTKRRKS